MYKKHYFQRKINSIVEKLTDIKNSMRKKYINDEKVNLKTEYY